ncbi:hypothetical protein PMG11_10802 [Penicillium brasilianum]|uniref:Uncharacterized protein n=1 Tax=Penicillium brasilianum TaxID=104259 RepID=A0A0F7U3L7_PENBI|nr:hypothetical protein PMG11_10802 [Penicillium brasilianum]
MQGNELIALLIGILLLVISIGWLVFCWYRRHVNTGVILHQTRARTHRDRRFANYDLERGLHIPDYPLPKYTRFGWVRPKPRDKDIPREPDHVVLRRLTDEGGHHRGRSFRQGHLSPLYVEPRHPASPIRSQQQQAPQGAREPQQEQHQQQKQGKKQRQRNRNQRNQKDNGQQNNQGKQQNQGKQDNKSQKNKKENENNQGSQGNNPTNQENDQKSKKMDSNKAHSEQPREDQQPGGDWGNQAEWNDQSDNHHVQGGQSNNQNNDDWGQDAQGNNTNNGGDGNW